MMSINLLLYSNIPKPLEVSLYSSDPLLELILPSSSTWQYLKPSVDIITRRVLLVSTRQEPGYSQMRQDLDEARHPGKLDFSLSSS